MARFLVDDLGTASVWTAAEEESVGERIYGRFGG